MAEIDLVRYRELSAEGQAKLRRIYETSFPEYEKLDFDDVLLVGDERRNLGTELYGAIDAGSDKLVGMAHTVTNAELMPGHVYVFFLAMDPDERGCGYGSATLDAIAAMHPDCSLSVDIETVAQMDDDVDEEDRANRLRRLHFYEKNGFSFTGRTDPADQISYDLLYKGEGAMDIDALARTFEWLEQELEGFHI